MDDKSMDLRLHRFRNTIPVNTTLKASLGKELLMAKKTEAKGSFLRRTIAFCTVAAIALLFVWSCLKGPSGLSAASLRVSNHVSFFDLGSGSGLGVSESNGTLYIPVSGQGVFAYDEKGFSEVYEGDVSWVRVSPDGTTLAFSSCGSVSLFDLESSSVKAVLEGDDTTYYEEPSWSPDGKGLIFSRKVVEAADTHGFSVKAQDICTINLKTLETRILCEGSYPSHIKGTRSIVFERDGQIVIKDLKTGKERLVGPGRFPSSDPRGHLIAYVKEETSTRLLNQGAAVRESIQDIWIADVKNPDTRKQVTTNYPHPVVDEEKWANSLQPSNTPQVLSVGGTYSYYNPVWSSDSGSLFALKNSESGGNMRVVRVDLSETAYSPEEVVRRFIQALIKRDEDYARSLMTEPGDFALTLSNPRQVGYSLASTGTENGRLFVEGDVHWQYTALPYYQVVKSRYYLVDTPAGYLIDSIVEMQKVQVYEREGMVYLDDGAGKTPLFDVARIPGVCPGDLVSLAYHRATGNLFMVVNALGEQGTPSLHLVVHNTHSGEFPGRFDLGTEIGASKLTVDSRGRYAALDLFSQGEREAKDGVYVADLLTGESDILRGFIESVGGDGASVSYWREGCLAFEIRKNDQAASYILEPNGGWRVKTVCDR